MPTLCQMVKEKYAEVDFLSRLWAQVKSLSLEFPAVLKV
jgi:hypothetical protein